MIKKNKIKIIVAHPARQHSFKTATAIEKSGYLYAYITTVYQKKHSITSYITSFLGKKDKDKANSRKCTEFSEEKVFLFCEILSLFYLLVSKICKNKRIIKKLYMFIVNEFGKKVANFAIKNNVDAVIMYDETSVSCFEILKKKAPNIKRILDVSTVNRLYIKNIYDKDMKLYGHNNFKEELDFLWNKKYIDYYKKEIDLTQAFIFPSQFVKKSYFYTNPNINKFYVIPYGVEKEKFKSVEEKKNKDINKPLLLIFVGQISIYKGLHHLLSVVSSFPKDKVRLKLVGSYNKENQLYKKYKNKENIEFCGFVSFEKLPHYYSEADVFVFPTIGEGFGLVVLEAMSVGMPVICSENAGGNDVIEEGVNGFIYNPLSENELKEKINYFIKNRNKINEMGINSKKISENYTWQKYYLEVSKAINNIMEGN